jgi:hypothetical protein
MITIYSSLYRKGVVARRVDGSTPRCSPLALLLIGEGVSRECVRLLRKDSLRDTSGDRAGQWGRTK